MAYPYGTVIDLSFGTFSFLIRYFLIFRARVNILSQRKGIKNDESKIRLTRKRARGAPGRNRTFTTGSEDRDSIH